MADTKQPRRIEVLDPRPETAREDGSMRRVALFDNVPRNWTDAEIISQFGIAEHLRVIEHGTGSPSIIQRGRDYRPER